MTNLYGMGTALITPFLSNGNVDFPALERLLIKQITAGVDYFVVLGTTAEAATMTDEEKTSVRDYIVRFVESHPSPTTHQPIPMVLGLGGNCTAQVVRQINFLRDTLTQHFAAILSVCPYYNKPSQEGLFQHFSAIAQASPIPVLLYNIPGRTGINMLPETVMRIYNAHPDKICGIKEASGNVEQIKRLINLSSITHHQSQTTHLLVISGDDGIAAELMQAGAAGLISASANAFPEAFRQIVHAKDASLQAQYAEMVRLLFIEGNPAGVKTVLADMGLIGNYLRLPLVPNSPAVQAQLHTETIRLQSCKEN